MNVESLYRWVSQHRKYNQTDPRVRFCFVKIRMIILNVHHRDVLLPPMPARISFSSRCGGTCGHELLSVFQMTYQEHSLLPSITFTKSDTWSAHETHGFMSFLHGETTLSPVSLHSTTVISEQVRNRIKHVAVHVLFPPLFVFDSW